MWNGTIVLRAAKKPETAVTSHSAAAMVLKDSAEPWLSSQCLGCGSGSLLNFFLTPLPTHCEKPIPQSTDGRRAPSLPRQPI